MDVSVIIAKSRIQSNTSAWQKSDDLMLQDLNIVYKEIFSRLATKSKKYTRQTYKVASVANQNEYQIQKPTSVKTWLKRVLNISVKYSSDWEYKPCKMYNSSVAVDSWDMENPYCIERDWSVFIYPAIPTVIAEAIVMDGQYIPLDLELATTSVNIKLALEYHDILISGLNMWNFWDKQLFDKKAVAKQEYEEWIARMISEWWQDIESWYEQDNNEVINESNKFLP
jgi:hypothetical protein